nr:MAG TPA: hypothetical protein [Caudoviricetes sp.]
MTGTPALYAALASDRPVTAQRGAPDQAAYGMQHEKWRR